MCFLLTFKKSHIRTQFVTLSKNIKKEGESMSFDGCLINHVDFKYLDTKVEIKGIAIGII